MKVREVIERISFNVSTLYDLSGKSSNNLFDNKNIVYQLKTALDKYASFTLAIEAIYSFPMSTTTLTVPAPTDALRTQTYKLIVIYVDGRQYFIDMVSLRDKTQFPYPINSIPRWMIPFENDLYVYPQSGNSPASTKVRSKISITDTTIPVDSTASFIQNAGRVTIGSEKIKYGYLDSTNFYNCSRGIEDTTAVSHIKGESVQENNCHIFYYKKHFTIPMYDNNIIDQIYLDKDMEVCDEHIEVITDYTSYKLLSKVDANRAAFYKVNFDEFLIKAKQDINKERSKIRNSGEVHSPYLWETPYYNNFIF